MQDDDANPLLGLTTHVVSAYVSKNTLGMGDIGGLIQNVHQTLTGLGKALPEPRKPQPPAVPIRKSITPDYLVSLEDGGRYKSLKRHLRSKHGLTPDEYRAKWGLPSDYPMVAPGYSATRSILAKRAGLGAGGRKPAKAAGGRAAKR